VRLPDDEYEDDEYEDEREDLELEPLLLEELPLSLVYDELDDEYEVEPLPLLDLDRDDDDDDDEVELDREPEVELELGDRRRLFFFSDFRFSRPPLSKTSRRSTPSRDARPSSSASGTASPANCCSANFCRNFGSRSLSLALARRTYADAAPSFPHPHS